MRYLAFLGLVSFILVSAPLAKAGSNDMHMGDEHTMPDATVAAPVDVEDMGNTVCPVMGGEVDPNISYVYNGKRYYFCCPDCVEEFKKDPEKYIEKM